MNELEKELIKTKQFKLKQVEAAHKCLEEATEHLKRLLKKTDLINAQIAILAYARNYQQNTK